MYNNLVYYIFGISITSDTKSLLGINLFVLTSELYLPVNKNVYLYKV